MEILIVVVVLVLAGAAFVWLRRPRRDQALPKGEPAPPRLAEPREQAPSAAQAGAGAAAETAVQPAARAAAPEQVSKAEPADASAEAPAPPGEAVREAARAAGPSEPTEEDVAALKKGLRSTRGGFITRLAKLFGRKKEIDPALLDEMEEVLITADIGVKTTGKILDRLRERLERNELSDEDRVWAAIREEALQILQGSRGGLRTGPTSPTVILVVGVNGVGKTTTIGKLASRLKDEGHKVILAAGDTFRAAAVLQLEVWGRRVDCPVVRGKERADPASVIFEAIKQAREQGADVVIADTAGRLHTKVPLMEELKKAHRTVAKALDGRDADEVLLVLDSTNGQNAIQQAQMFKEALPITGIALTKLDGTAKGGVILGIVDEHGIPVRYVGIGERVEDLREFEARSFVEALFAKPDDESLAA